MQRFLDEWHNESATVSVTTSGSTGTPKTFQAEKARMRASAEATCTFLRIPRGATALLCLPTEYIAGKMMVVRALTWPLTLITTAPSSRPLRTLTETPYFAALTPSQAYSSLQYEDERKRLLAIPRLLLGGGAISKELEEALAQSEGEVWSSYGMTETLSHIALRRIGTQGYEPMPHVTVGTNDEGALWIEAPKVCEGRLQTHDIAQLLPNGRFIILGRTDNVVCSGGVKLQIEQLEEQFASAHNLQIGQDFMLTWVSHPQWGQALTLLLKEGQDENSDTSTLPYLKHTLVCPVLPLTSTGKPAREAAHLLAETLIHP